jgi:hypothetical protein
MVTQQILLDLVIIGADLTYLLMARVGQASELWTLEYGNQGTNYFGTTEHNQGIYETCTSQEYTYELGLRCNGSMPRSDGSVIERPRTAVSLLLAIGGLNELCYDHTSSIGTLATAHLREYYREPSLCGTQRHSFHQGHCVPIL